jgi:hypothetical protein
MPFPSAAVPANPDAWRMAASRLPIDAATSVLAGRDAYFAENGFTLAAYDQPTTKVSTRGMLRALRALYGRTQATSALSRIDPVVLSRTGPPPDQRSAG